MTDTLLPYGRHSIDEDDIAAVTAALRSGFLTGGPVVSDFEKAFAHSIGAAEAVVVNSGTAALHLAVLAAGVGEGDHVIVPSVTFLATANAVRMAGGEVVFADVDSNTGLLTEATLQDAIALSPIKPKAIMPVHLNGHLVDSAIMQWAESEGFTLIADCCHALGASYACGAKSGDGTYEHLGVFSLHPVKNIAMGEGGMITTNNPAFAREMRLLRNHGMERQQDQWIQQSLEPRPWYYEMQKLGYNYRAPDILCALGLSQLSKLESFLARRQAIADYYDSCFGSMNGIMPVPRASGQGGWHLYPVLIDFENTGFSRGDFMAELLAAGIGTQVHYVPVHTQPYYRDRYGVKNLPGADAYYARVLSLPIYPGMTDADMQRVASEMARLLP